MTSCREFWRQELAKLDLDDLYTECLRALELSTRSHDPLDRDYRDECYAETVSRRGLGVLWQLACDETDAAMRKRRGER